jgi:hypothetical protein
MIRSPYEPVLIGDDSLLGTASCQNPTREFWNKDTDAFLSERPSQGNSRESEANVGSRCYEEDAGVLLGRKIRAGREDLSNEAPPGRRCHINLDTVLVHQLELDPHTTAQELAILLGISVRTMMTHLDHNLGRKYYHLRWISRALYESQKADGVHCARIMLGALHFHARTNYQYIITADEFWFHSYNPSDAAWTASRDELPERIKRKIDTEKCRSSGLCPVNVIHYLIDVPLGMKYNSLFSCDVGMPCRIQNSTSNNRRKTLKLFFIHLDRARPHSSKQSQERIQASKAKRLPHPVYRPDLAPSDFFLFGYLKEKLIAFHCSTRAELKSAVIIVFNEIARETFPAVFNS